MLELIKMLLGLFKKKLDKAPEIINATIPPIKEEKPALKPEPIVVETPQVAEVKPSGKVDSLSKKGYLDLADREGFSYTPYLCDANEKTIGFGSTKSDLKDLPSYPWHKAITLQQGIDLLKQGSEKYQRAVRNAVKVPITQSQFDALVSLCYNIGTGGLANSQAVKKINAKAPMSQILAAIKSWNKVTVNGRKVVNRGLVNRRQMECDMFEKGIYQNKDGCVTLIEVTANHKPRYKGRLRIVDYL